MKKTYPQQSVFKVMFPKPPTAGKGNPYRSLLYGSLEEQGIEVCWTNGYLLPFSRAAIRQGIPDVIHLQWQDHIFFGRNIFQTVVRTCQFFVEMSLLKLIGVQFVWTVHNLSNHQGRYVSWEKTASRLLAKNVQALIVHCPAAVSLVEDKFGVPKQKIKVVPHGHYQDWYPAPSNRSEAREKLGIPDEEKVLLYFGHIRQYKGVDRLIEGFRSLKDLQTRLVVIGEADSDQLAEHIRTLSSGDPRIDLQFRFLPDQELIQYLSACNVAALPYVDILTSGSAILAAGCGRAILAPATGCLNEIPDQLLYSPGDPSGFRSALQEIGRLSQKDLDKKGQVAKVFVTQNGWDKTGKRLWYLYQRILFRGLEARDQEHK